MAVSADVYVNADALRAVIADLAVRSPDRMVNLGDRLSGPFWLA